MKQIFNLITLLYTAVSAHYVADQSDRKKKQTNSNTTIFKKSTVFNLAISTECYIHILNITLGSKPNLIIIRSLNLPLHQMSGYG